MTSYPVDNDIQLNVTFTRAGAPADPDTVSFKIKDPSGNKTTYVYGVDAQVTKLSTGRYQGQIRCGVTGLWSYRWEGTGSVESSSADNSIFITPSTFAY